MVGTHGSPAKIERPRIRGILQRGRLFKLLDACRNRPVTWVSGPAGSGKTSLVATYIDSRKIPCLWYQIDEGDSDIATFFYYMGLAAKKVAPRRRKPLPLFTPEYLMGIPTFASRYFEKLYGRLKRPFIIVIDNYQNAPDDSKLHEILRMGLNILPGKIDVFLISRRDPPSQFVQLRAADRISFVGWDEIRFTLQESRQMVRIKNRKGFDNESVKQIHEKTGGWAAGLVLMTESIKLRDMEYQKYSQFTPAEIFDYFADEVFEKADPETQTFLLKTALLPRMTADITEKLTGIKSSDAILSGLYRDHFFTERSAGPEPSYRYHPLFREFLMARTKEAFSSDEIAQIERSAATLLIEAEQVEDAASLLVHSRDWKGLIQLILIHARRLLAQGRHATLTQWLVAIPEEAAEHAPWLLSWLGLCKLAISPVASRTHFEKAFHLFEAQGDDAGTLSAWSGAVQTFLFEFDDFRPLDKWIRWLDERVSRKMVYPSREIAAGVASGMTGALTWRMPSHPALRTWVRTAIDCSQEDLNIDTRLRALTNSAIFYVWMGEFAECGILIGQMRKLIQSQPVSPAREILLKVAEAMLYNSSAEWQAQAGQAVSEGIEIAEKTGVHIMDTLLYLQGVSHSLSERDRDKAHEFLFKLEKTVSASRRTHLCHYFYFLSWYFVLVNDVPQATASAKECLRLLEEAGRPVSETAARPALALIYYQSGDIEEAFRQLGTAKKVAAQTGSSYSAFLCYMTEAYLSLENGDSEKGLDSLQKAFSLGRQKGYVTMVHFWRPDIISYLCARALEAEIEVEYGENLVRKLRLAPPQGGSEGILGENWPWPLKIHTLGRFAMLRDGKLVQFSRKAQERPLSMLKVLIALGGKDVREENIADILWPEADGDTAHGSFETTLYRLRSLIGLREAIQFQDGRLGLDSRYCWVDVWAFEQFLVEAETHWREGFPEKAVHLTEKALRLYKGPFLGKDVEQSWSLSISERLRNKFMGSVGKLGDYWSHEGHWERALECYQKGLEIDDLVEGFCQGLMVCYQRLDRGSEALLFYQRFEKRLKAILGVEPTLKTKTLRDDLVRESLPSFVSPRGTTEVT